MFEKSVSPLLTAYFEAIFSGSLTAYRKQHSCLSTLLRLTEDWKSELDHNNIIGTVLIDLSKAFDRLAHNLLLEKLLTYGIGSKSLKLLASYLKNRTQCVKLGNIRSSHGNLMSGVPQGSVLGPHLFNIFVNDLVFYNVKKAKLSAYADDKQLYFSHREALTLQHTLNSELAIVSNWICDNGLILNTKKCESLLFRRPKTQRNQLNKEGISFSVNGTVIRPTISCKLLDVHIKI